MEEYDAGLLNDFGGGNVEWWQNYIRSELERARDFYAVEITRLRAELEQAIEREQALVEYIANNQICVLQQRAEKAEAALAAAHLAGMEEAAQICWDKGIPKKNWAYHDNGFVWAEGFDTATEHCYNAIRARIEEKRKEKV